MEHQFDELAKALAGGMSRREALRRVGGGLAGVLLASLGLHRAWGQAPRDCESYCRARIDPLQSAGAFGACVSSCQDCVGHGGTLCGVSSASGGAVTCCTGGPTSTCCGAACVNTQSDPNNCGGCAGAGGSVCTSTQSCCNGTCTNTATDPNNCGGCAGAGGSVCTSDQSCCNGTCATDPNNCGTCGNVCMGNQVCFAGQQSTRCCVPFAGLAPTEADCCSLVGLRLVNGFACGCIGHGFGCTVDETCCSGNCQGGVCV